MEEKMNFEVPLSPSQEPAAPVGMPEGERAKTQTPPKGKCSLWLEQKRGGALPLVLSFLLPFSVFSLCLIFGGLYPFGDEQIINYDGWHQYYPFLLKLWDHFHEGTSFLYDWSMGMGTNFLSMLSYYGSSPLNLLLLFVPVREFRWLFMLFVMIRFGLAGLFSGLFLRKITKNPGFSIAFFASGYALSSFLLGYFWNNMWLDTVALFPLLCLCLVILFREQESRWYVLVLALSLFSNYYIGYMSCVFLVLAFFALCIIDRVNFNEFLCRGFRLLVTTLLGAGLAAVLLLPALLGLLSTASTQDAVPMYVSFYESVRDLLAPFSSFHAPAVMEGLPNITTTATMALFGFAFLWAKKVGFRKKIVAFFLLVFLLFSMNFSVLNYIWHGMHYTNMIPYRFAYVFCFLIVVMAYYYYKKAVDAFDWIDAVGMLMFAVLVAFCAFGYYETWSILATVGVLAVSMVLCAFCAGKIISKRAFSSAVCVLLAIELCVNTWLGTQAVGTTSYSQYFDLKTGQEIEELVQVAKENQTDPSEFYRMEVTEWRSLNDSCFYGYNGISQFSSSANRDVSAYLLGLGMPADPGSNRFVYVHGTPLANMALGVKYLISKTGYLSDTGLKCVLAGSNDQTCALYEESAFSGLGFMIEEGGADFQFDLTKMPYERQNELFCAMTGLEGELFTPIEPIGADHTNLNVTALGDDSYEFSASNEEETDSDTYVLRFTYRAPQTGMIYVYADVPTSNFIQVNHNWHCIEDYPNFFSAGYFKENEEFSLRTVIDAEGEEFTDTASYDVVVMNQALWQEGLAKIQDEKMQVLSMEDTGLKARVNAKTDGYLYTSIPFEKEGCWTLWVDGKEAEITPFADAFVGVRLTQGEHEIELRYSPLGFVPGAWITAISLLLLILLWVWERKGGRLFPEKVRPTTSALSEDGGTSEEGETQNEPEILLGEKDDHTQTCVHHQERT